MGIVINIATATGIGPCMFAVEDRIEGPAGGRGGSGLESKHTAGVIRIAVGVNEDVFHVGIAKSSVFIAVQEVIQR